MVNIGDIVETDHGIGEVIRIRSAAYSVVRYEDGRQLLTHQEDIFTNQEEEVDEPDPLEALGED